MSEPARAGPRGRLVAGAGGGSAAARAGGRGAGRARLLRGLRAHLQRPEGHRLAAGAERGRVVHAHAARAVDLRIHCQGARVVRHLRAGRASTLPLCSGLLRLSRIREGPCGLGPRAPPCTCRGERGPPRGCHRSGSRAGTSVRVPHRQDLVGLAQTTLPAAARAGAPARQAGPGGGGGWGVWWCMCGHEPGARLRQHLGRVRGEVGGHAERQAPAVLEARDALEADLLRHDVDALAARRLRRGPPPAASARRGAAAAPHLVRLAGGALKSPPLTRQRGGRPCSRDLPQRPP